MDIADINFQNSYQRKKCSQKNEFYISQELKNLFNFHFFYSRKEIDIFYTKFNTNGSPFVLSSR
jgi:hypothetical protein